MHAIGLSPEILADASVPLHATLYALAVVGEALSFVPEDIRTLAPEIHWRGIVGLRNQIVHAYFRLDLEIVADVVKHRLDPLIASLDRLIKVLQAESK